ncbi:MarR family winged helix-turn-helix transcriptional regulator [uncultured Amnibacterium sp.]|uniref:MarR family winged helix-turn-helix transcriptional regulator n=1 Tax=uncultured Amnibacterium sp. TaxID=1631851 RepID=UPI0035CA6F7C
MAGNDEGDDLLLGAHDAPVTPSVREVLRGVLALQLAHRRAMAVLAGSLGLTESDVLALALLVQRSRVTVGALAAELGLTRGSASLLVTRLETAALARRLHDDRDRRVVHIIATDAGAAAVRTVRDAYVVALEAAIDGPDRDLRVAASVLQGTAGRLLEAAEASIHPPDASSAAGGLEGGWEDRPPACC